MELTQKGEMVSRLHAKTNQIGKLLNNLEKYNYLMKDDCGRSPTTPNANKTFVKISPLSPKSPPMLENKFTTNLSSINKNNAVKNITAATTAVEEEQQTSEQNNKSTTLQLENNTDKNHEDTLQKSTTE